MAPPTAWKDSADDFGVVSVALHWLVAALVLALLALGLAMQWTIGFEDGSLYLWLKHAHIGIGVLLCMALLSRITWRLASGAPAAHPRPRALRIAAKVVPALLLLAVTFQAATGGLGGGPTADGCAAPMRNGGSSPARNHCRSSVCSNWRALLARHTGSGIGGWNACTTEAHT
ncbi:cytochrome b/b6 domain-containing protein [Luteimonas suaedae]|uniref:cytochrome b/b6 domain-containing protein n=1 Tax=Luteimonas suaedae TaxID=2605430 RepID=UPI0011EFAE08|nr:cytochrome b/b6 domain-containing protein [Luteimonas suaedae]